MTIDKQSKRAARELAAREGISYTAARRRLSGTGSDHPDSSPAALNELGVNAARERDAAYGEDDWSWDARTARKDLRAVLFWEEQRAGREVRLWSAVIETRVAALDADDAWHRLSLWTRHPVHRHGHAQGLCMDWDIKDSPMPFNRLDLAPIAENELTIEERRHMDSDHPGDLLTRHLPTRGTPYGDWDQAQVADYCHSLTAAAARVEMRALLSDAELRDWESELEARRRPLPDDVRLTYWRGHQRVDFLAGYDRASARARADELAATVVDYAGRPIGRVVDGTIEADDGFRSATDGCWVHPAASGAVGDSSDLWEDYAHVTSRAAGGAPVGSPAVLKELYLLAAQQLQDVYAEAAGQHHAYEAKLHTQPDGRRTLTLPGVMSAVVSAARREAVGKTADELQKMADEADYFARRVYGKAVDTDDDVRRIEVLEQRAKVWTELAETARRQLRAAEDATSRDT